ncbi:type I-Fv CRISPR-associated protein Cas5fv [Neptuniibacter sp. 1_MG-2023]|jgi:hypothetical protein|uniref:type I-Fv CRISPR-associated protein Cas5fv n=1 Tax=Neptuniibacter sp. 1_MG-2023 TaxID=3062662 RepID=UPI0026E24A66|nr:type I-Fv CRISPR-associated protein Cas5fv [Neptuniibacter sp. 1_MG-2023]MDO6592340.1 type I-Fv CRISPR-associated protein Cas5fv [Neptuniibacter sp. 1_MG-2023]
MIEYESSWRNSFLDPATSNNEPLPKNGRKFIGSMTNLKKPENYLAREVTIDTVMGVLNRLIGDQRKLYQARASDDYYFSEIEKTVYFEDRPKVLNTEVAYIRNISGSTDQNSYTGMIRTTDPAFSSDYSQELWGIIALTFEDLCEFIISGETSTVAIDLDPISIINRLEELNKLKTVENENDISIAYECFSKEFEDFKGLNNKGQVYPISFYCAALYLQLKRLACKYDLTSVLTKSGGLSGISKNGFTKKDFMARYTTGDKKRIWGNPYMREEFVKGEGKIKQLLTKASGQLEVNIDIEREDARHLKLLIDSAGVSSFYLGKKGLAYVSDIRI